MVIDLDTQVNLTDEYFQSVTGLLYQAYPTRLKESLSAYVDHLHWPTLLLKLHIHIQDEKIVG